MVLPRSGSRHSGSGTRWAAWEFRQSRLLGFTAVPNNKFPPLSRDVYCPRLTSLAASTWKFTNTQISNKVEYAFQALALDEKRYPFRPALWERVGNNRTILKQVWFAGNHGNIGGGWQDQAMASISLACSSSFPPSEQCHRETLTYHHCRDVRSAGPFGYRVLRQ
jgi:hypothetical protein